jgi:hypothetical protein
MDRYAANPEPALHSPQEWRGKAESQFFDDYKTSDQKEQCKRELGSHSRTIPFNLRNL